ncbi:DUF2931 family protein [Chryseobacterium gleum]|uniref:DUF2931 family protein n=1 Tax=Chryseobacterium gleum TaxID=250 RepID=UPI00241D460A|nr:DUF2931 family protein [Chryseobacterium gleum]
MKGKLILLNFLGMMFLSIFLSSCQKNKYPWEPGISAPKYYPITDVVVDFGNAGNGTRMPFDNGWGNEYGGVVSGGQFKDIPKEVLIKYNSSAENYIYQGKVSLDQKKILALFRKYNINNKNFAHLVVGMAPGGWIRVWFTTIDKRIEVAKAKLKGQYDNTVDARYKVKSLENWGKYYTYWQHHGIPYEAWANNEKEYDIIFDFDKPDYHKIGFNYISADGTFYQRGGERLHQKLPVQFEPIAWLGKSNTVYECNVAMPKNFKKYIEQKKLKEVRLKIEIENDDEHAVIYLITNNLREKIMRFRNKIPTAEEKKNNEYSYAKDIEYFTP